STTSPAPASSYAQPASCSVSITAKDSIFGDVARISKLELYQNGALIAQQTFAVATANWTVPLSALGAGSYVFYAKAYGSCAPTDLNVSSTVTVTVTNIVPTVTRTQPASAAVLQGPTASIALAATASDSDGTVSKVEFLSGS